MTSHDLFTKGARVWVPEPDDVWEGAEVQEDYKGGQLIVRTESGQIQTLTIKGDEDLPPLRNPDILIGENDLTSLSYLHEPAVLYNLKVRFCNQNAIYTYCGIVLVAINPYQDLPIYGPDTIWAYRGQAMGDLDPHIFAVSEEAYTKLERESRDQSIIVSGESGAGKTVSAKYAMRYFATVGGSATETQVERKVLASNPIMEAIGNAKTTRNDNSSRFGKFIEIHFNRQHHIQGASMRTYLLEKSRVVFQAPGERNYHIFYQLCAARDRPELVNLQLENQENFHFTNQGESAIIDNVDDATMFEETRGALTTLGFSEKEQSQLFHILAAVLHLGNVRIAEAATDGTEESSDISAISSKDKYLSIASKLLEVDAKELRHWLCHRRIISMREVFIKSMTVLEATSARDALAKHIYAQLFAWIVKIINKELESSGKSQRFIGVLDIYGFETFETNSFEQFCINYANEKLQQQFNQHVFKLEQEEYMKEEIEWKLIDFYDNQPCIDLIESKLGILDLLDEECRMPKGTDQSWVEKLYERCNKSKHFVKPRFNNASYIIHHFADNVEYLSTGFLEKNRDTVVEEQIEVLRVSHNDLVKQLFLEEEAESRKLSVPTTRVKVLPAKPAAATTTKQHKKTVGSQFRDSLNMLMNTLNATTPHYVRCIKPNDSKSSFEYNAKRAVQQLRACGVLETIRISAAGYPSRWTYAEFFQRYRVLCKSTDILWNNMKGTCETILKNVIKDEDQFCFGKTKIFFRAGQVAYLEKLRAERLRACCIMMQKHVRGRIAQHKYLQIRKAVLGLQRYGRGLLARRMAQQERETRAAIRIQKHVRGFVKRRQFQRISKCILGLQTHARGVLARRRYISLKCNAKAIVIQRHIRGYLARKHQRERMHLIVVAQSAVRRWLARRQLRKLKLEARSVEHVKKLNKGLENKIISLQQRIEELLKENNSMKSSVNDMNNLRKQLEELKVHEAKTRKLPDRIMELEEELRIAKTQLRQEFDDKVDMVNEASRKEKEYKTQLEMVNAHNKELKSSMEQLNEKLKASEKGIREELRSQLDKERTLLIHDQDQDRQAYQKLLGDFHALELKHEAMERENMRLRAMGAPVPAPRSGKVKHERSFSNASSASGPGEVADDASSTLSEMPEDGSDFGYGSVRSNMSTTTVSSHGRLENIDWSGQSKSPGTVSPATDTSVAPSEQDVDIGLVLKLQQKVKELERDRQRMQKRLEELDKEESPGEDLLRSREMFKLQELEMENSKLRADMDALRLALSDTDQPGAAISKELARQSEALQEELSRRRDECIQLRSVLANQTKGLNSIASNNYGSEVEIINEDGELVMAFEAQKKINRQLEDELQTEKKRLSSREAEWRMEIEKLREDNERQQRLLSLSLTKNPQNQTEAYMQYEIKRLTAENLELQEKCDNLAEQLRKHKKQNRILAKKYRDIGGELPLKESPEATKTVKETGSTPEPTNLSVVRKKDREYMGMFEYRQEDEPLIVRRLIYELKPKVAITLLPGLPAYILFMCIRHTDFIDNDEKVRSLLTTAINGLRKVIKKRSEDLDTFVLWLSNTLRLLHTLKQYSGDKTFQAENTPTQNEQCLRNFDLSQYRQVLSDIAVWIYQGMVKQLETRIQPLVQPAILEHEAISGLSSNKPGGMRGRTTSVNQDPTSPISNNPENLRSGLNALLEELTYVHRTLSLHGMDPELITQVFRQLFYFICAAALNTLLLRKDLCHWSKGMQIRYNISHLEQWLRDHRVQDKNVVETLQPVIQASQLLQARKTEGDVVAVCEMCDKLSVFQIIKILNLYTPADEYEERVPASFIRQIQERLGERAESQGQATLLMDSKFSFPVRFPFNPSNIRLEDIEIPESLHLPMLRKV